MIAIATGEYLVSNNECVTVRVKISIFISKSLTKGVVSYKLCITL